MLLYVFLTRRYRHVDIMFIRHTDRAEEVDEDTFFHSPASGGTLVSSALQVMDEIVKSRFRPADWNIYAAQASDGDNSISDSDAVSRLLTEKILPVSQFFAYLEVGEAGGTTFDMPDSSLWTLYQRLRADGTPLFYKHWSFGKHFAHHEAFYRKGLMGLAYEIVINSSPCISYLMEENTATMQTLVIAHAAFGHNHFFKNNYLFKQWTDADGILDYLDFAKSYVAQCEERHGRLAVEQTLDAAHALMSHGIDRYPGKKNLDLRAEERRAGQRRLHEESVFNDLWRTVPTGKVKSAEALNTERRRKLLGLPQEN